MTFDSTFVFPLYRKSGTLNRHRAGVQSESSWPSAPQAKKNVAVTWHLETVTDEIGARSPEIEGDRWIVLDRGYDPRKEHVRPGEASMPS